MVERLGRYHRKGSDNTMSTNGKGKRSEEPLSPAEALDMLKSALTYCQQAGLKVAAGNRAGVLTLQVNGAEYITTGGGWELVPIVHLSALSAQPIGTLDLSAHEAQL